MSASVPLLTDSTSSFLCVCTHATHRIRNPSVPHPLCILTLSSHALSLSLACAQTPSSVWNSSTTSESQPPGPVQACPRALTSTIPRRAGTTRCIDPGCTLGWPLRPCSWVCPRVTSHPPRPGVPSGVPDHVHPGVLQVLFACSLPLLHFAPVLRTAFSCSLMCIFPLLHLLLCPRAL